MFKHVNQYPAWKTISILAFCVLLICLGFILGVQFFTIIGVIIGATFVKKKWFPNAPKWHARE